MAQIVQWNTTPSGSAGNHFTARSVYVDNVYGNDTTAQIDNQHRPFSTLQAAIDALGNAGYSIATVHILSTPGVATYTYSGSYSFSLFNIVTYSFVSVNITNIPTSSLNVELSGRFGNLVLDITYPNTLRVDIFSKNNTNSLTFNYAPQSGNPSQRQLRISGSYTILNTVLNPSTGISGINLLFNACNIFDLNLIRTGEKTDRDSITIANCKTNNTTIRCFNIVNNTPHNENNIVFKILNSTLNELTGITLIELDGFAEGLCELYIENSQIKTIDVIRVLGFIRCINSSIDSIYGGSSILSTIYVHIPDNLFYNPYDDYDVGKANMVVFSHCTFGLLGISPIFALDVPLFKFEYCSFRPYRYFETTDIDDRFRFIIWDTCRSTSYIREIEIKYCNLIIRDTLDNTPINAFLFVRGTENTNNILQRYYIEHCNITSNNLLDYVVLIDEKYFYGGPYSFLANLIYDPITSLGSNGSYDVIYKFNEAGTINRHITLYSLSTSNRTYIRDYYNRYDSLSYVHSGTASTDVYVYHTEANNSYDLAGRLYGDSKQVIRFWNSGALGINAEDKTHVLEPGFTGPVFITSASNFLDYKEFTIINNSGIPITINPTPGETIDGFTSIVLGVNQRITLKRVGTTAFASI